MENLMKAAYLPGNSTVVLKEVEIPEPGHGEVLIRTKPPRSAAVTSAPSTTSTGKGPEATRTKSPGMNRPGRS